MDLGRLKRNKFLYYSRHFIINLVPKGWFRRKLADALVEADRHPDRDAIMDRVEYYNKLSRPMPIGDDAPKLGQYRLRGHPSFYYCDALEHVRWFPADNRWRYYFGDINTVPDKPTIVKSRPVSENNTNSILLNLDKLRHFVYLDDRIPFSEKRDQAIFRGAIYHSDRRRERFMQMYYGHPLCDAGTHRLYQDFPREWKRQRLSLRGHLNFKFIVSLEGHDVGTNLKWIMSSQSVAVMPRPTCESWFMEGRLIPEKHYIEIAPDFSNFEEKLRYYIANPRDAEEISRNARRYWEQFRDPRREKLISLLVLDKFFRMTGDAVSS